MRIATISKFLLGGVFAVGIVMAVDSVRDDGDIKKQAAQMLRSGAQGARWLADKADIIAERLDAQDGQEYISQQWAKVDQAQHAREHIH